MDVAGPLPGADRQALGQDRHIVAVIDLGTRRHARGCVGEVGRPPRIDGSQRDLEERAVFDGQGVEVELGRRDPHRPPDDEGAARGDGQFPGLLEDHPLHRRVGFTGRLCHQCFGQQECGGGGPHPRRRIPVALSKLRPGIDKGSL